MGHCLEVSIKLKLLYPCDNMTLRRPRHRWLNFFFFHFRFIFKITKMLAIRRLQVS